MLRILECGRRTSVRLLFSGCTVSTFNWSLSVVFLSLTPFLFLSFTPLYSPIHAYSRTHTPLPTNHTNQAPAVRGRRDSDAMRDGS